MDEYFFFLVFLPVSVAVTAIVALILSVTLRGRVKTLEQQVADLTLRARQGEQPAPAPAAKPEKPAPKPAARVAPEKAAREPEKVSEPEKAPQKEQFGRPVEPPAPPPIQPPAPTIVDRVMDNIIANWVIWLAAVSLGLGGVFIVQYGIERGYLGPTARVIAALGFGAALVAVAEYVRRKNPDQAVSYFSAHVALAAGGVASLFAGVVAAHVLYDLTGPLIGFTSMALVSWLALAGGLIYGPVLAVIGLLGAYVTPLLVASEGPTPLMYLYFLLVLSASLAVERWQRWIWLSSLAVFGALVWGILLHWSIPNQPYLAGYTVGVILAAVAIPAFGLPPKSGDDGWVTGHSFKTISRSYPTVLAILTALAATGLLVATSSDSLIIWQSSLLALIGATVVSVLVFSKAQNLDQTAAIFGVGLIAVISGVGLLPNSDAYALYGADYDLAIRKYFPFAAATVLGLTLTYMAGSIWRSGRSVRPFYWNTLTALLPLFALVILWGKWNDTQILTKGNWLFLIALLTALLTGTAFLVSRKGEAMLPSTDVLSCGVFLGLGFLAQVGLSPELQIVAFAALAVAAFQTEAERGFHLLGWVSLIFTSLTFGRIVIEPGLWGAIHGSFLEGPVYIASAAALFWTGAWRATQVKSAARLVQFETATVAGLGTLVSVLLGRVAEAGYNLPDHALAGLYVSTFLMLSLVQFKRAELTDRFTKFRHVLGWSYFVLATMLFLASEAENDPVFGASSDLVAGFFPFDSIVTGFVLPALILAASLRIKYLPQFLDKRIAGGMALALAAWALILEIRRFWHGNDIDDRYRILTPELYSYTVALLIATVACILAALWRKDPTLRKWGLVLVGVTALKVFLWDMSDLQGLGRATSFIALGLTLAGIAWLFQRFSMEKPKPPGTGPEPDA